MGYFGTKSGPVDFRTFDLSGPYSDEGSISFFIRTGNGTTLYFEGTGYLYDGDQPKAGIAERLEKYTDPGYESLWVLQQVSIPVADVAAAALTPSTADDLQVLAAAMSGPDTVLGRDGDDYILGFDGNDDVTGFQGDDLIGGGPGKDYLSGQQGSDGFLFAEAGKANADKLEDFKPNVDWIGLDHVVFASIGAKLGKGEFQLGHKADDANDFIIFSRPDDDHRGKIFYDADGKGGERQVLVATTSEDQLDHKDFLMI